MPEGPIVGLNVFGLWFLDLLFAALTIYLAWAVFKIARNLLKKLGIVGSDKEAVTGQGGADSVPLATQFKPALRSLAAILIAIAAVRIPRLLIADAGEVDSLWDLAWNTGLGIIRGFGQSGESNNVTFGLALALVVRGPLVNRVKSVWVRAKRMFGRS